MPPKMLLRAHATLQSAATCTYDTPKILHARMVSKNAALAPLMKKMLATSITPQKRSMHL